MDVRYNVRYSACAIIHFVSGRSILVVRVLWEHVDRVQFSAPRPRNRKECLNNQGSSLSNSWMSAGASRELKSSISDSMLPFWNSERWKPDCVFISLSM